MAMAFKVGMLRAYFIAGTQDIKKSNLTLPEVLTQALQSGITAFQYREKGPGSLSEEKKVDMAHTLRKLCETYKIPFIVDDDIDLALETAADGIHVGQKDERVTKVIQQVGTTMFVGLSCDTKEQVAIANETEGISYIGSGPVYPTGSKADADPVIGIAGLKRLVQSSRLPVVAIGGITEENISELPQTGVAGASVISMIAQSNDIKRAVTRMRAVFEK